MQEIVIKILCDNDFIGINSLTNDDKLSYIFFKYDKIWYSCRKIHDGIYLHVWTNTDKKINSLMIIFNKLWIDFNELEFYVK